MLKKILGWVILVLLAGYVAFAAIWAYGEASKNVCKGIDIHIESGYMTDSVTRKGVMSEINRYPEKLIGTRLPLIDTKKLEEYLKSYPQFENVVCNFSTDGRLKVKVTPMVAELRIFEDSSSYYINKDGKRMASKASFFVDVPVVSGRFDDNFQPKDILRVTRFISQDPLLSKLVGMVRVEDSENILLIPRIHGHVINFGDTTRLEEKRRALLAMYKEVIPYKGWEEYDTISVKYRGQIVATRRNKGARYTSNVEFEETDMEESTLPSIEMTGEETAIISE
ncbi:MAG: hypothetical protein J1F38_03470 [Muribaculaceae bacterium]|nr:hypothetical protein [Muribaculaceae bacterium]